MNIKILNYRLLDAQVVPNGIWANLKLTLINEKNDIYEITILRDKCAYEVIKNNKMICGSYYPDAGKENCTMPDDIFQQAIRVAERF